MSNDFSRKAIESLHAKISDGARHFSAPTNPAILPPNDSIPLRNPFIDDTTDGIARCSYCSLAENRKIVAVASEHSKKRIMILSDFPGYEDENSIGVLFESPQSPHNILHRLIERLGCTANTHRSFALRCVPRRIIPENGVSQCSRHTLTEITAVDPDCIICCGYRALKTLPTTPPLVICDVPEFGVIGSLMIACRERKVMIIPPPRELEVYKEWRSQVWELLKQEIPTD